MHVHVLLFFVGLLLPMSGESERDKNPEEAGRCVRRQRASAVLLNCITPTGAVVDSP